MPQRRFSLIFLGNFIELLIINNCNLKSEAAVRLPRFFIYRTPSGIACTGTSGWPVRSCRR